MPVRGKAAYLQPGLCCAVFATSAPAYGVGTGLSGDPFGQSVRTVGRQFPSASAWSQTATTEKFGKAASKSGLQGVIWLSFGGLHVTRMLQAMKPDEVPDPVHISLFGSEAIVKVANLLT